jgi:hypothetical protein
MTGLTTAIPLVVKPFPREGQGEPRIAKSTNVANSPHKMAYFRHKVGVNNTKIVNTSSRPSSMAAEHTQVWKLFNTP